MDEIEWTNEVTLCSTLSLYHACLQISTTGRASYSSRALLCERLVGATHFKAAYGKKRAVLLLARMLYLILPHDSAYYELYSCMPE